MPEGQEGQEGHSAVPQVTHRCRSLINVLLLSVDGASGCQPAFSGRVAGPTPLWEGAGLSHTKLVRAGKDSQREEAEAERGARGRGRRPWPNFSGHNLPICRRDRNS